MELMDQQRILRFDTAMIITLDGPAGAGKSSTARALAHRLGYRFLDTGAMYRAVALAAIRRSVAWSDTAALAELVRHVRVELSNERVFLDGEDVTDAIRSTEVTSCVHYVADQPAVRAELVDQQRRVAMGKNIVCEGRDQGTVAFPDAECKIFLTATPAERARRRQRELQSRGESVPFEVLLGQQNERDHRDSTRPVGRLSRAEDAVEVVTDGMTPDEVLDRLEQLVRDRARRL
jgi:cytidylate kinase/pantoate ligase/cytidylate kinase